MAKKKQPVDPRQQELHDLIELKKLRQAAAEHRQYEADLEPAEEKIVPKTFKEKWDNFWFHYKKTFLVSVVAVFMAGWFVKDVILAPDPDLTLNIASYSGPSGITGINDDLQEKFEAYLTDYNGDGQLLTTVSEMYLGENGDSEITYGNVQKFIAVLSTGEDLLFIMDQVAYDYIFSGETDPYSLFIDMEKLYPGLEIAEGDKLYLNRLDESLTDTVLGKAWKLDYLNNEYFICVRHIGGNISAKDNEENQAMLDRSLEFVQKIVAETFPEWEGKQPTFDPETMKYLWEPAETIESDTVEETSSEEADE